MRGLVVSGVDVVAVVGVMGSWGVFAAVGGAMLDTVEEGSWGWWCRIVEGVRGSSQVYTHLPT